MVPTAFELNFSEILAPRGALRGAPHCHSQPHYQSLFYSTSQGAQPFHTLHTEPCPLPLPPQMRMLQAGQVCFQYYADTDSLSLPDGSQHDL